MRAGFLPGWWTSWNGFCDRVNVDLSRICQTPKAHTVGQDAFPFGDSRCPDGVFPFPSPVPETRPGIRGTIPGIMIRKPHAGACFRGSRPGNRRPGIPPGFPGVVIATATRRFASVWCCPKCPEPHRRGAHVPFGAGGESQSMVWCSCSAKAIPRDNTIVPTIPYMLPESLKHAFQFPPQ